MKAKSTVMLLALESKALSDKQLRGKASISPADEPPWSGKSPKCFLVLIVFPIALNDTGLRKRPAALAGNAVRQPWKPFKAGSEQKPVEGAVIVERTLAM